MNAQNSPGKWWILSESLESIATALQTLVAVTSSTRNFVRGCFHCGAESVGCFKGRENSSDGAWFDCEQFQADHPYCYENQVALHINNDHIPSSSSNQTRDVNHVSRECNGIFATTSPPPVQTQPLSLSTAKEDIKLVSSPSPSADGSIQGGVSPVDQSEPKKVSKYKKYKQSLMDSTSFASKLEQDHFGQRIDALRSEGEILTSNFQRSKSDRNFHRPSIKSPVLERRKLSSRSLDFDLHSWDDDDSLTSLEETSNSPSFGEIWKPHELESAFEVYNSSTLQSFGYINSVQQKKTPLNFKGNSEKFEDVFPSVLTKTNSPEQNNNDKSFVKIQSSFDGNAYNNNTAKEKPLVSHLKNVENGDTEKSARTKTLTREKLKKLIEICMSVNSANEFNIMVSSFCNENLYCDKLYFYCGKSFNRKLLYNLVKEAKKEYLNQYSNSLLLSPTYPISIIENKIICALEFSENCQPYQVALLEDVEKFKQRMLMCNNLSEFAKVPDEILIENVTAQEIKKEGRLWQNVEIEEKEIKKKICQEMFQDLLHSEISVIGKALSEKIDRIS